MTDWVDNGILAAILGSLIFALGFLPGLAWQYRHFGRLSPARLIGLAAVCLYGTALATYTMLPLPDRSQAWCDRHARGTQLTPFAFIDDLRAAASMSSTWRQALLHFDVLQVAFNVALFVPLGVIVRRYLHHSVLTATLAGLAISCFIELTQYTGLWFIYPCAYRVADVDDVILNTTGALVGAVLAPLLLWWMPNPDALGTARLQPRPVTAWRRWVGMALDAVLVLGVSWVLSVLTRVGLWLLTDTLDHTVVAWLDAAWLLGSGLVVFVFPAWNHLGASVGQTAVWLTPKWRRDGILTDGSRARRVVNSLIVPGPWIIGSVVDTLTTGSGSLFMPLGTLVVLAAIVSVPFTRTRRSLSGVLTGAEFVDIRAHDAERAIRVH